MNIKKTVVTATASVLTAAAVGTGIFFGVRGYKMKEYKNAGLNLPKEFTITAHTGCMGTQDNSLSSMKTGAENGADIIEFDVYFTADGTPVLSHDTPVGNEVTLDEAFAYLGTLDGIRANVDLKGADGLEKIYPLALKNNAADRIFYTGVGDDFLEAVQKNSPEIPYYFNVNVEKSKASDLEYLLSLVEKVKNAGAVGINFNCKSASKELVEVFHENGLLVSIWTVDKEYDMYKILSMSPDNITTRNPDKLYGIIKNYR